MTLTIEKIAKALPHVTQANVNLFGQRIIDETIKNEIYNPNREAAFLSQIGYESAWFTHMQENLNYSSEGLRRTWPSRFPTTAIADEYAHQPEKIANHVYASRYGNGDEASGDGWKYRGRGLIQLTFKDNYKACGSIIDIDLITNPDMVATVNGAIKSACWFWKTHNLNILADAGDITNIIRIISGGSLNLSDRIEAYNVALAGVK
jgi:putative chitinase